MDVNNLLKNVNNLEKYVQASQVVEANFKNCTVQFNISTVLSLKKLRTYEIEYFSKYENSGAAIKIFELMLLFPPSQTWSLLGNELISLLQYWLSSLRNHLIFKNNNWWPFLCVLLQLIKDIRLKESNLSNILAEETADSILSLVTHDVPNISQKHKILCIFNLYSADCSREIRFALRTQFDYYFITLAEMLATCGDVAFQYSIMDTLLRWLVPRHDNNTRLEAAAKWFPGHLYNKKIVNFFLESPWQNFFQDARDFLNMHNESNDLVTSVIIKKLTIGNVALVTGLERRQNWLDINTGTKCMSLILDRFMLRLLGISDESPSFEILVISEANTREVKLQRNALEAVLSVATIEAPHTIPSSITLAGEGYSNLEITISAKSDLSRIVEALQKVFADKFQAGDTSFPRPDQLKIGCIRKQNNIRPNLTPSSASTSSIAQLHEKLTTLPKFDYHNKPATVCAYRELSNVAEVTEPEDHSSWNTSTSTFKNRYYGVSHKSRLCNKEREEDKEKGEQIGQVKCMSPSGKEQEKAISCLLVATIGSADESIINNTLERLSKSKGCTSDNVLELLVQEAIQNKFTANENVEAETEQNIKENKPTEIKPAHENQVVKSKTCTVISNSTSAEESNTDIVEGTQLSNVNFEKRNLRHRKINQTNNPLEVCSPVKTFDEKAVEEFFSQHFAENRNGELIISPTLARKFNETSSESNEDFAECCFDENMDNVAPDLDVVECLNFIVNKICDEFEQCNKIINQDLESICPHENPLLEKINEDYIEISNQAHKNISPVSNNNQVNPDPESRIFAFNTIKESPRGKILNKEIEGTSTTKTPVVRKIVKKEYSKNKAIVAETVKRQKPKAFEGNTPFLRKKRKLYSSKDQHWNDNENVSHVVPDDNRITRSKSKITCYDEIEKDRNDYMKLRNRKSKKADSPPPSPRTKRNNELFDKLKEQEDSNIEIILADRTNVYEDSNIYNFKSDSEDDDFKKSKIKPTGFSAKNKTDTISSKNKPKSKKTHPVKNTNKANKIRINNPVRKVIDERMRDQPPDVLNTSLKVQKPPHVEVKDSLLILKREHKMEVMNEDLNTSVENKTKSKVSKRKTKAKVTPSLKSNKKKEVNKMSSILNETSDRTRSPLPGLVVETVPQQMDTGNNSMSAMMLDRFKQLYEEKREPAENDFNTTITLLSEHDEKNGTDEFDRSPINCKATSRQLPPKDIPSPINKATEKYIKSNNNNKEKSSNNIEIIADSKCGTLNIASCSRADEEKSIETVGYSPITAHGDLDMCQNDLPPSRELLNQSIEPRNLEVDDLNQSIKEFFVQLNKDIVKESTNEDDIEGNNSQKGSDDSNRFGAKAKERLKSPILSISRITSKHGPTKGLPSNSRSGSINLGSYNSRGTSAKASGSKSKKRQIFTSQISPVKLFEVHTTVTRRNYSSSKSSDSEDEKHYKNMFYKKPSTPTASPRRSGNYWLRSDRKREPSLESAVSTSTKKSPVKKISIDESSQRAKRRRSEDGDVCLKMSDSGRTGTDLNDWFRSMKPTTSKEASLDVVFEENMSHIIEKLDTTVNEIHHNTDRSLINMFVEAQSQLDANKEQRNAMYKSMAMELLANMVKLIDTRFADMNAKSDEMDRKFMDELRRRATDIITEDCRKKKAIVRLLREDVQAVKEFINKNQ